MAGTAAGFELQSSVGIWNLRSPACAGRFQRRWGDKRVNSILRMGGLVLAAFITVAHPANAQDKILLRFSTAAPPPDFLSKSLERFKEEVDKAAPNQFEVRLHPGSSLFRQGTEVPAIQRGN